MATLRSFWFGEMSPYQRLCMKSFVDYGHKYILYAYQALEVPAGVELQDANQIAPQSSMFWYGPKAGVGRGSVAAFSNIIRYRLLHEFGEWWVDADVVCLSEKLPEADIVLGWEDDKILGNAILKFPKRYAMIEQAIQAAERLGADLEWGETGPLLMTALMKQNDLLEKVSSTAECYPISSADALQLLAPAFRDHVRQKTKTVPLLHTWNEILRRAGIFKWMAPPAGSFMSELFVKHAVSFSGGHTYSADDLQRLSDNYSAFTHWSWHQPRIDARQSRLTRIEREFALLKDLYAEALLELRLRRPKESAENGSTISAETDVPVPLSVVAYGPQSSFAGDGFNLQPNGQSAVWVRTSPAPPAESYISFDGIKLETVISDTQVTAGVPEVLLMSARTVFVKLKGRNGQLLAPPLKLVLHDK
jgi:hypothetical protein